MAYIGVQPTDTYLSIASQQITGTGSATYTLNYSVSTEEDVAVFVNNVRQNVSSYTVSGNQLTLGGTISASDECWILFLGRTVGTKTPAIGSVTNDMLVNSSITLNGSAVSLGGSASVANTPSFRAYQGSTQSVSNNTLTVLNINTENFDTDGAFDTSTYRFTPQVTGKYFIFGGQRYTATSNYDTNFDMEIRKNGSGVARCRHPVNHGDSFYVGTILEMNGSTDYANLTVYHTAGLSLTVDNGQGETFFGGFRLL